MKILNNLNFLKNDQIIGLKSFQKKDTTTGENPKVYTGDYATMFKFNLDKTINLSAGHNLYYLS